MNTKIRALRLSGGIVIFLTAIFIGLPLAQAQGQPVNWTHLSSASGDLPIPPASDGQSGLRVVDLDKNGQNDYVITYWRSEETVVWYRQIGDSFEKYVIDALSTELSHGEKFKDIDGDGDIDLLFGDASWGNKIYWWENPYPNYEANTPWVRRIVRDSGENLYHDNIWGDFDGDGLDELIAWNQNGLQLLLFEIPADPRSSDPWDSTQIFSWTGSTKEYKGAEAADINLDDKIDFVGGGGWFEHTGGTSFTFHPIADAPGYSQIKAGQLIPGGRPEVVCVLELEDGPLNMYEWTGSQWQKRTILATVPRSHTLQLGDINQDGHLDIMTAELGQWSATSFPPDNSNAKISVLYGDGQGNFIQQIVFEGQGDLEGQLADIDNDGDLDIVAKPFRHNIPRVDIYINQMAPSSGADAYNQDFESYAAGDNPADWLDTAANSSMAEDDSLFEVFDVGGEKVFGTTSTAANIHSHYVGTGSAGLADYEYSGRMMMTSSSAGIGVTFLSDYDNTDTYYRLRRYGSNAFRLSPHGTSITGGTTDTGVVPAVNVWYRFRIQVEDTGSQTEIRARVWEDGTVEPSGWQIDCYDDSGSRLTAGTIGVWSYSSGSKYWDDLVVGSLGDPPVMVDVPDVVGLSQSAAEADIVAAGLSVGAVTTAYSDTVLAGDVISQDPFAGTSVPSGSAVDLVVSLGALQMVDVPDVVGLSQSAAEADIVAAGLSVGAVTTANSDTVPAGDVISQDPFAGTSVPSGSAVDLVISLGTAAYNQDFESYAAGDNPADWLDTAANSSMAEDDSLFEVFDVGGEKVFGTTSTAANIHSHYVGTGSAGLADYEYSGRMMMTSSSAGIGVTFLSDYDNTDTYYRLRRYGSNAFRLSPHGTSITGGTTDTGVVPAVNVWYRFRIQVEDTGSQTEIRARVWEDGTVEPPGWQIDCYDDSGSRLTAGTIGVWSYSSGSKYWDDLVVGSLGDPPVMVDVPDVVGLSQSAAEADIVAAGLSVGAVTTAYSDTVLAGDVISQDPFAGTSVPSGSAVDLVVSLGALQMVDVPDVVGLSQSAAEADIVAAGLSVGAVTTAYSDTVLAGDVISQDPFAGTSVPSGSAVDLVVSLGALQMVDVPDVVGLSQSAAEADIVAAGLSVGAVTTANSDTVPAGDVISQDPFAGTSVPSGSAVDLVISLGTAAYNQDFESYAAGDNPADWLDTAANSSMAEDDSLFEVFDVGGEKVFGTTSTAANIHSHYVGTGSAGLADYEYSGRMMMTSSSAGIGVTFLSDYDNTDTYYRLRRYGSNAFRLSPHGTSITGGTTDTGVVPAVNVWYRFRIQVEDTGSQTEIRARVWEDGTVEPSGWQVNCYDNSGTRLIGGTFGLWSYSAGSKYWDDLTVTLLGPPPPQYGLTVDTVGDGSVQLDPPGGTYNEGTLVQLTAVADAGFEFDSWAGAVTGTDNPVTITMDGNKTATANFVAVPPSSFSVWYGLNQSFGQYGGQPQRWVNILGNVSDPEGVASLSYSLNGAAPVSLRLGPDNRRLELLGDFNADLAIADLLPGPNMLELTATDGAGNLSTETVTINYQPATVWPLPYTIDWSSLTTAEEIQDVAQVVDGKWRLESGNVRTAEPGYDRLIAVGDMAWQDYEVTVQITLNQALSSSAGFGVLLRWDGHTDDPVVTSDPKSGWLPLGAILWHYAGELEIYGNGGENLDRKDFVFSVGTQYWFKARVETVPGVGGLYSLKVWEDGQPEPPTWDLTGQEQLSDPQSGSMMLIAHLADVSFGNVTINPLLPPAEYALDVSTVGLGQVDLDPPGGTYTEGTPVTLTAVADAGYQFSGWSGDLITADNPATVVMSADYSITATFEEDTTPPVISNILVSPNDASATVSWQTNEPTTAVVDYGETTGYELGSVTDPALVQDHTVILTGLDPGTTYHLQITATDYSGYQTTSSDVVFSTSIDPSGIDSDDFNAPVLNTDIWQFVNPVGDGDVQMTGSQLQLVVPAGTSHDVWTGGNFAPRVMQSAANVDFEIEVKFDTAVSAQYQMQGLLVEESAGDFLRFDFYSDGSSTRLFAASFSGGSPSVEINTSLGSAGAPLYMRVTREGDQWTQQYSLDGVSWQPGAVFNRSLVVTAVGVFAGNTGSNLPAHIALVDYFINNASPGSDDLHTVTVNVTGSGSVVKNPDKVLYALSETVELTAIPDAGWSFDGWGGNATGMENPTTVTVTGDLVIDAFFIAAPPAEYILDISTVGLGQVDLNPPGGIYTEGTTVTLTATADAGWQFSGWSGDLTTTDNPATVVMSADYSITATFELDTTPPVISNILVSPSDSSATVSWQTNEPTTAVVDYGETTAYGLSVTDPQLVQDHTVILPGLVEGTTYHLQVTATDFSGYETTSSDVEFSTSIDPSGIDSDDFNAVVLNTDIWQFVDPVGDGDVQMTGSQLQLVVPAGTSHDVWTGGNFAPRVMQSAANVDFEIEVKFDSAVNMQYQMQGLLVEEGAGDFLRFDFYSDGSSTRLFAASFSGGSPGVEINTSLGAVGAPLYMRVTREGDQWTQQYSLDGVSWQPGAVFNRSLAVTAVGVFAGNAGSSAPAHTALVDYFINTASPIIP